MADISKEPGRKAIARLSAMGLCCSQIMVELGLESLGDRNPQLLDAVAGLCGGLWSGLACGTLTGAACLLSMLDPNAAKEYMIPGLVEWFSVTFGGSYGSTDCAVILGDDPMNKLTRCPVIMEQTVEKCRELLLESGYEL